MVGSERGVGVNSRSRFGRLVVLAALLAGVAGCTSGKAPTSSSTSSNDLTPQGSIVATEFPTDTMTTGATSAAATSTAVASSAAAAAVASTGVPGRSSAPGSGDPATGSMATTAAPSTVTLSTRTAPPPTSTSDVATSTSPTSSTSKSTAVGSAGPWPTGLSVADQDKAKLAIAAVQNYLRTRDQAFAAPKSKNWAAILKKYETGMLADRDFPTIDAMSSGGFHQTAAPTYRDFKVTALTGPNANVSACVDSRPRILLKPDGSLALERYTGPAGITNFEVAHYQAAAGAWLVRNRSEATPEQEC